MYDHEFEHETVNLRAYLDEIMRSRFAYRRAKQEREEAENLAASNMTEA